MKKSIFTLFIMFSLGFIFAQTVPNGGFENWSNSQPTSWTTNLSGNVTTEVFGVEVPIPVSVFFGSSTTDAHSGSLALELHPATFGIPGTEYSYLLPGIAQLGTSSGFSIPLSMILDLAQGDFSNIDFSDLSTLSTLAQMLTRGEACTTTPYGVKMWVKFQPQGSDSLILVAYTKSNGTPVSYAYFTTGTTMNNYTEIEAEFDSPLAACDSICIIVLSGGFQTDENTVLIVDDVTLNYTNVAVENHQEKTFSVYPNPVQDKLSVQGPDGRFSYQLHDLTGRLLMSGNEDGHAVLNVASLPAGVYMLRLQSDHQTLTQKVIVR
ncbi:MAG: T9SS type A sorting domain-containing protein [Bacteroidales bacterium]|nr:T9SS type A sorting domain-containing protein [Bacteroidales bacterium]